MQKGAGMTPPATVRVTDPQEVQGTIDTTAWPLRRQPRRGAGVARGRPASVGAGPAGGYPGFEPALFMFRLETPPNPTYSCLIKPADTVGELGRVEHCASHMASLKVQDHGMPMQQSWLGRVEIGSPTVSQRLMKQIPRHFP
jgi:hypothetical protein